MVGSLKELAKKACQWNWVDENHLIEVNWYNQWSQMPNEFQLINTPNVFLSQDYIQSIEQEHQVQYGAFRFNNEAVGWAIFFLSPFSSTASPIEASQCVGIREWVIQKWQRKGASQWVLLLGNPFVSGEHGFVFKDNVAVKDQAEMLCKAMNDRVHALRNEGWKVNICLIKDFHFKSQSLQEELKKCGFVRMEADPIMVLPMLDHWKSFDDYLKDLSSKFRSKAMTAKNRSSLLMKEEWDWTRMSENQSQWYALYDQVYKKASHRWQQLSASAILNLKARLEDNFIFNAYLLEGRLVAFSIAVVGDQEMEAHLVGFDYHINKSHYLYSRILYDYVELGIQRKVSRIVFGRTAVEMKSSLGALPLIFSASLRHAQPLTNLAVKWLTGSIEYNTQSMRQPWKTEVAEKLALLLAD